MRTLGAKDKVATRNFDRPKVFIAKGEKYDTELIETFKDKKEALAYAQTNKETIETIGQVKSVIFHSYAD